MIIWSLQLDQFPVYEIQWGCCRRGRHRRTRLTRSSIVLQILLDYLDKSMKNETQLYSRKKMSDLVSSVPELTSSSANETSISKPLSPSFTYRRCQREPLQMCQFVCSSPRNVLEQERWKEFVCVV